LIYVSLSVAAAVAAGFVAIASLMILRPLYQPPYESDNWISAIFAGLAAILAGSAGIAVGLSADEYSVASWTEVSVGGIVAVFGIVLTVIGVWIYEPTPDGNGEPHHSS
jgi:hypothetical protein